MLRTEVDHTILQTNPNENLRLVANISSLITDYNNNQLEENLMSTAAAAALATHDYTNRTLMNSIEDRCFPSTYQGCLKVFTSTFHFVGLTKNWIFKLNKRIIESY